MDITEIIIKRITAAKNKLMAKGYECPTIEIGIKVMKDYGPALWGFIHLGSPDNHMRSAGKWKTFKSLDEVLDEIDASVNEIPTHSSQKNARDAALAKLSKEEKTLLNIREHEFK